MRQVIFQEICEATAYFLEFQPRQHHGEFLFSIDGVEALLVFNEEADDETIFCYINIGCPRPHDRAGVCEHLLRLNLGAGNKAGSFYAFDGVAERVVFCARLSAAESLDGEYLVYVLSHYVDQTREVRQLIAGSTCLDPIRANGDHARGLLFATV